LTLTRFAIDSSWFSRENQYIKLKGFLPRRDEHGIWSLSTFRIDALTAAEIWRIGDTYVVAGDGRTPKARTDLAARYYKSVGLEIYRDDQPERHVNVTGWSEEKSKRMSTAQELTALASEHGSFHLHPDHTV